MTSHSAVSWSAKAILGLGLYSKQSKECSIDFQIQYNKIKYIYISLNIYDDKWFMKWNNSVLNIN